MCPAGQKMSRGFPRVFVCVTLYDLCVCVSACMHDGCVYDGVNLCVRECAPQCH
jgi:hypothetical protein